MNIEGKKDGPKWAIRPNKTCKEILYTFLKICLINWHTNDTLRELPLHSATI